MLLLVLLAGCATSLPPGAGPPRHIELTGTLNTRDLGGYRTEDGRRVRWRLLYRSDDLSRLDDHDLQVLEDRQLRVVYDLRTDIERYDAYDRLPSGVRPERLPMSHPSMDPRLITRRILSGDASEDYFEKMLGRANRTFAIEHGAELAQLVRALGEPGSLPALLHCTYGKDRTGFASAMILSILGVPWETVMEDYLLSNVYLDDEIASMSRLIFVGSLFRISRDNSRDLLGVQREYLESARSAIVEKYGSIEAYRDAIGLDEAVRERLREALLEPAPSNPEGWEG